MIAEHIPIRSGGKTPASPELSKPRAGLDTKARKPGRTRWPVALRAALAASLTLTGTLAAYGQAGAQNGRPALTPSRPVLLTLAGRDALSRRDLALKDAAHLLTLVRLPSGSARVAKEPSGDSQLLGTAAESIADPNLVDLHRFFVAPQNAWTVYRYERSHPPLRSTSRGGYNGYGTAGTSGNTNEWFVSYSWPPEKQLLDSRVLVISIAALPGHRSGIRLDAEVTWLPAKPVGDVIPTGAKVLTAVLSAGMNPGEAGHAPVTTTDPAKIEGVRNFVNQLSVVSPGGRFCPADFGQKLTISFAENAQVPPFAVVVADVAGCEEVQVQRFGHAVQPELSGYGLVSFVERELGFS